MIANRTLPDIKLLIDGVALAAELANGLEHLEVQQVANLPSHCELHFIFNTSRPSPPRLGSAIRITVGDCPHALFVGELTACRHSYLPDGNVAWRLRAYDALHRLRKTQNVRQFEHLTTRELVLAVASEQALTAEYCGHDVDLNCVMQWCQSDLTLLTDTLQKFGLQLYLQEQTLLVFSLQRGLGELNLQLGDNLLSVEIEQNADPACRAVEIHAWQTATAETLEQTALGDTELTRRLESTAPAQFYLSGHQTLTGRTAATADEARAVASATLAHRLAGEIIVHGTTEGNAELIPGRNIQLTGVATDLCGQYLVTRVRHSLNRQQGYISEFDTAPPVIAPPAQLQSTVAVVIDIDDPEDLGRVQVMYPSLGGLTSHWLALIFPGGGPGKGLLALPDVEDRVLVQFIDGDTTQAVVLGGLLGLHTPPTAKIKQGKSRCHTFTTRRGQVLQLDDARGAVKLANRDGSYVDLTPGKVVIHAATDLTIEAPGQSLVFKAKTIDFEQS